MSVTVAAPSAVGRTGGEQSTLDAELIEAVWRNDMDRAELLIGRGADVNALDDTGQNPFLIASAEGYTKMLRMTMKHGADLEIHDSYGGTALIRAAERGHADIVGILLQSGIPVDHVNNLGWTALHETLRFAPQADKERRGSAQDYIDTARLLIAAGADAKLAAGADGSTPLEIARDAGLSSQVQLLEEVDTPTLSAQNDLSDAAARGDVDAAAIALKNGARLEERNRLQQTPLLTAAATDHLEVARLLVRLGANPNAVDEQEDTPWLVTGVTGSVSMGRLLLKAGADLTLTNRFGGLSPIPASERGHADYVEWVVSTDVDLDHVNNPGWTALLEAVVYGDGSVRYQRIVRTLLSAGADSEITDSDGLTALVHARNRGQTAVADILRGEQPYKAVDSTHRA